MSREDIDRRIDEGAFELVIRWFLKSEDEFIFNLAASGFEIYICFCRSLQIVAGVNKTCDSFKLLSLLRIQHAVKPTNARDPRAHLVGVSLYLVGLL